VADATEHLRAAARRVVETALERVPVRAALLAGSAGRGDADFYSDLDLLLYVDELPEEDVLDTIRATAGGGEPRRRGSTEHFRGEEFDLDGIRTEISFVTVARVEWRLEQLRDRPEEVDEAIQKVHLGILEGLPLHGSDLVDEWRTRLRDYPDSLRRHTIERHWSFLPLWYYGHAIELRDAELWRLDALLDGAFNLLRVLAALNRLYFARAEFKRMRALVAQMTVAPPDLPERLESLFRVEPAAAAGELGRLLEETRALVTAQLPDLELPLEHPPGTRQQPWG
jgi:predicted nucleotidyltransferase